MESSVTWTDLDTMWRYPLSGLSGIRGYHQDVTRNIENERKYQNLTAATSQIYHAIYHIDLIQDRIEKLAGANQNYTPTGVVTSATAQLNDILEKMVAPSHHEIMQYFFDLTTI